jgi:glycosyltransferase involved in cell wall biosynthesis
MRPFITVVIPAYNAERTIRRAIDSVVLQNYPDLEIIIVDDASSDGTARVVEAHRDRRIKLLRLPENLGECGAMNAGIAEARGDYVAFLDADDEWLATKLSKQIATFEQSPKASFVTCACHYVDTSGHPYRLFGMPPHGLDPSQAWRMLLSKSFVAKPCVVARTQSLKSVGPFDTTLRVAGDQDMWIKLASVGEIAIVPEVLTIVHDTPTSLTNVFADRTPEFVLPMIERHIEAHKDSLAPGEIRQILAERYTYIGRNLYIRGNPLLGARYILRAITGGVHVGSNLWYLITASPPARMLKRLFLGSRLVSNV